MPTIRGKTSQRSVEAPHYDEKARPTFTAPSDSTEEVHRGRQRRASLDKAYDFLHGDGLESTTEVPTEDSLRRLRRKIDRHILPVLWFLFFFHFMDKYLMGYAIVMGLPEDIHLRGYEMNNCVSAIYWSYLAMTLVIPFALNKLPIGKWVGAMMICNGLFTACTSAVQGYGGLLTTRVLMGASDASMVPSLILLSSQYYRKDEQALRFAFWVSSIGPSIMVGGAISYGFQGVENSSWESWRIMYLTVGLVSGLVGTLAVIFLPDTPMDARFLTKSERKVILQHVSVNKTGIANPRFEISQLKAVFLDPQVWLLVATVVVLLTMGTITGAYGTAMIRGFGYSSKKAALLNMPGGAIALFIIPGCMYLIRYGWVSRFQATMLSLGPALLGACLLAFVPKDNHAAQLVGLWFQQFASAMNSILYQWLAANVGGHTKRSICSVLLSAGIATGGIIGPYALRPQDKPEYHLARVVIVICISGGTALVALLAVYYTWVNKRRDRLYGRPEDAVTADDDSETWANLTDQERKSFRYVL
ncbi:unnamed protein product [Zymoseptoria tritici ST99CH_1A5]|uniref:Major facilitator superfamily (MFS) profile domain-containing protein n=1 Tax=Zymoseptoria tritici ST99CH_1A5 TaxID=1276529 RepID=A0A1Y6LQX6_ZYMTR|nr:unnamed protein product [Zymoseptoria tritici ST99CH_1A5]